MKKFQVKNTYWEELLKKDNEIKVNYKILNKFFCEKEEDVKKKASKSVKVKRAEERKHISILDAKATQDVAIILSTYSLSLEDTVQALND